MANFEIIVNYVSGGGNGAPALKAVTNVLSENGHNYTVHQTQYKKHATELASELTSGEDEVNLIVIGGDGTIGEVISGIVNFEKVTLGIVASGTGNDFIRAAKLPKDYTEAAKLILKNNTRYLDFMRVGNSCSVNCVGAGMDVDVLARYETVSKVFKGKIRYYVALIDTLLHTKFHKVRITEGGETYEKTVFLITAANGTCIGGGMPVSPNSDPYDGKFNIVYVEQVKKSKILGLLLKFLKGKHIDEPVTHEIITDKAIIEVLDEGKCELDGEITDTQILDIQLVTQTLKIFA